MPIREPSSDRPLYITEAMLIQVTQFPWGMPWLRRADSSYSGNEPGNDGIRKFRLCANLVDSATADAPINQGTGLL